MSRAAPDVCADFLGSFVADTTRGQFTKGGKWLVWKFEVITFFYVIIVSSTSDNIEITNIISKNRCYKVLRNEYLIHKVNPVGGETYLISSKLISISTSLVSLTWMYLTRCIFQHT